MTDTRPDPFAQTFLDAMEETRRDPVANLRGAIQDERHAYQRTIKWMWRIYLLLCLLSAVQFVLWLVAVNQ